MAKNTDRSESVFEQFESAGPDIRELAARVRTIENDSLRNSLLQSLRVLVGKPPDPVGDEQD